MKRNSSALALILMAAMLTASCGTSDTPNNGYDNINENDSADTTHPEETFDVPKLDFGGRDLTILACDENVRYTYIEDAEQTGDTMDDAIYMRNRKVEDHLNVNIVVNTQSGTDLYKPVETDIVSGDSIYDIISPHILKSISQFAVQNYVYDLSKLNYVDFDKSWWNNNFTDTLSLNGKLLYAAGDMIVPNARVMVFNKQMMEDYKLPDIYDTVREGRWTLDTLGTYTKDAVRDINGDGVLDTNDYYAFSDLANTGLATSFVHASNELFVTKGSNGFDINLGTEKMQNITDKLYEYLYRDGNTKITNVEFGNGNVLFGSQVLLKLQILRDYNTDFGIIPFPMYDESQDGYYSSVWNGLVAVPITATDKDLCGAALEAMAYFSQSTLMPAYYDKLLDSKFARDDASTEMLNIIFDGLVYDVGLCFDNFIGCYSSIGKILNEGSTNLTSFAAQNLSTYTAHYDELWNAVK